MSVDLELCECGHPAHDWICSGTDGVLPCGCPGTGDSPGLTPSAGPVRVSPATVPHRRFVLERREDHTGVSGTGIVADGVLFDGLMPVYVLCWRGEHSSVVMWHSEADLLAVHGHGGSTVIRWVDTP